MKNKKFLTIAFLCAAAVSCSTFQPSSNNAAQESLTKPTIRVVMKSEVKWSPLNPLRGDKGPKAGTLWGDQDRKASVATGFLVQFVDGFSSPPHIHNITYRGVVISGLVHNDDPDAAEMWMPVGSFWTQPAGEVHITAARGSINVAYIEIDKGPYLVLPTKEAFDRRERPINVHAVNIVWIDPPGIKASAKGPKIAYLWGSTEEGEPNGTFIKLPAEFKGTINSHGSTLNAVVIKGIVQYKMDKKEVKTLEPGSYFSSNGAPAVHQVLSKPGEETILYVRTNGKYDVIQE